MRKHQLITAFAIILFIITAQSSFPNDKPVYLAVVKNSKPIQIWPITGVYLNQQFHKGKYSNRESYLKGFKLNKKYQGVSDSGRRFSMQVDHYLVDDPQYARVDKAKSIGNIAKLINRIGLISTQDRIIRYLPMQKCKLDTSSIETDSRLIVRDCFRIAAR